MTGAGLTLEKEGECEMTLINPNGKAVAGLQPESSARGPQPEEMKLLHIYSQPCEHFEAKIVGNEAGLRALVETINDAIRGREQVTPGEVFATDGEGYDVRVVLIPGTWHEPRWKQYPPHYCDRGYDDDSHQTG